MVTKTIMSKTSTGNNVGHHFWKKSTNQKSRLQIQEITQS